MLRALFIDMNAYFASCEQHLQPHLRNKPIVVAPVETDHTSCIAASYEAKPFGIRTGTPVGLARHLCPGLIVVHARPPLYVDLHHRIKDLVENHLHVDRVESIDEMSCRLPSNESAPECAAAIANAIKKSLAEKIGPALRCSIGIAPNRFLAKLASDMQKPDGLTFLDKPDLPEKILPLSLRDLPGIGHNMEIRLASHGVTSIHTLWQLPPDALAHIWGGINGRTFWLNLHGESVTDIPTRRGSINHSNVLSPDLRTDPGAHAVLVRLIHKGAARLRHMGFAARRLALSIHYENHAHWSNQLALDDTQDTQSFLEALDHLWNRRPRSDSSPKKVGITLFDFEHTRNLTLPLFPQDQRRLRTAKAMDTINARFGRQTLYFAEMHQSRHAAPMRIAFNSVPDDHW